MADDLVERIARAMEPSGFETFDRGYTCQNYIAERAFLNAERTVKIARRKARRVVEAIRAAGLVIVPRNLPDDVLASVIPFPDHLLAQHPDPADPWHSSMRAATMADRMVLQQRWIDLITALEEHE